MDLIVMKAYVVVIDGYFTRDGQVYVSDERCEYTQTQDREAMVEDYCDNAEINQFYKDIHGRDIYLGIYHWNSGDVPGLITYVAKKHGFPVGILQAYEV